MSVFKFTGENVKTGGKFGTFMSTTRFKILYGSVIVFFLSCVIAMFYIYLVRTGSKYSD